MTKPETCILCQQLDGDPARRCTAEAIPSREAWQLDCVRCGVYMASEELIEDRLGDSRARFPDPLALRLSWVARDACDRKRPPVLFTHASLQELASGAPLPSGRVVYFDRVVEMLSQCSTYPGLDTPAGSVAALAARVLLPKAAFISVVSLLSQDGDLAVANQDPLRYSVRLTAQGWRRAEAMSRGGRGDRAFVAMWFDTSMRAAFEEGIKPALIECKYEPPFRVDDPEHDHAVVEPSFTDRIDDRILSEIRRARFVVADATGHRPNVYFEAGFADGLGIPIIWTCKAGSEADLSFDTRQIEHIVWKDPSDLRDRLAAKIRRRGWGR